MPKPPITGFSNVSVNSGYVVNNNYGLYLPQLTTTKRNNIPQNVLKNGGIIYNITTNTLEAYVNNVWVDIYGGVPPANYVVGPHESMRNNLAVFDNDRGNLVADSNVPLNTVVTVDGAPENSRIAVFSGVNIIEDGLTDINNVAIITNNGVQNNIAIFQGNNKELIDSGVTINRVPV